MTTATESIAEQAADVQRALHASDMLVQHVSLNTNSPNAALEVAQQCGDTELASELQQLIDLRARIAQKIWARSSAERQAGIDGFAALITAALGPQARFPGLVEMPTADGTLVCEDLAELVAMIKPDAQGRWVAIVEVRCTNFDADLVRGIEHTADGALRWASPEQIGRARRGD